MGGPNPNPNPKPPSVQVCAEGKYDWKGTSTHRSCGDGCKYDVCDKKIHENTAVEHCHTQAQIDENDIATPRGCNYGSSDNTCAYDDSNRCVYADLGPNPNPNPKPPS